MKFKPSFYLFMAGIVLLFPLRLYLCLSQIDPETGFYLRTNPVGGIFTVLLLAMVILLAVLPRFERVKGANLVPVGNLPLGVLAILLGFLMDLSAVVSGFGDIGNYLANLSNLLGLLSALSAIAAFVGGILFVFYGMMTMLGHRVKGAVAGLMMLPAVWLVLELMHRFLAFTNIATVPNRLLLILFLALGSLFLTGHARVVTDVGSSRGIKDSVAYGMGASLTGLLYTISRSLASLLGRDVGYQAFGLENLTFFVFSLYTFVFSLYVVRKCSRAPSQSRPWIPPGTQEPQKEEERF